MKKEIENLLTAEKPWPASKELRINGAFTITSVSQNTGDKQTPPTLTITYTLAHDEFFGRSRPLFGRTFEDLEMEIPEKMNEILEENAKDLTRRFRNGYLG